MKSEIAASTTNPLLDRIAQLKATLGKDLLIFAHFYQTDSIVRFADFVGDSLQLAYEAARQKDRRYLVVCAVSFMAEMVRILCDPAQMVFHPAHEAHCPLAEMASIRDVEEIWTRIAPKNGDIIPVVYVNSTSEMKAFCGRHGGLVCTSSNARKVFQWVLAKGAKPFFFPDENLGRNTAEGLGIKDEELFLVDPDQWKSGPTQSSPPQAKVFLWKGFCYVHKGFMMEQVRKVRETYKDVKVAVHPECVADVCKAADLVGATSAIKAAVEKAPSGSKWAIGTEWNLVNRLQNEHPDKLIIPLRVSRCQEMAMVRPERLIEVLDGISQGELRGEVRVPDDVSADARTALQRMLEIG